MISIRSGTLFVEPGSGRRTAFARHPSQAEEGFSALATLVIAGYVLWSVLALLLLRERAPAGMSRAAAPATLLAFSWFLVMDARLDLLKGFQPLPGLLFLMPAMARVVVSPGPEEARMWRSA
ncbi:MAG TPA: hypothetical protein VEU33_00120 [Archangium sp.]|nr:hypothetical protein [Archangium sp.]